MTALIFFKLLLCNQRTHLTSLKYTQNTITNSLTNELFKVYFANVKKKSSYILILARPEDKACCTHTEISKNKHSKPHALLKIFFCYTN